MHWSFQKLMVREMCEDVGLMVCPGPQDVREGVIDVFMGNPILNERFFWGDGADYIYYSSTQNMNE